MESRFLAKKEEPQGQLERAMLPFVMRELLALVMKKKHLPMEEALYYIYSSRLYKLLLRPQAKMWYSSTLSLYEDLEKEKSKLRHSQDNDPELLLFKMFCLESYREAEQLSAENVLLLFSRSGTWQFLEKHFEVLHTQGEEYIVDTIRDYIRKKK